MIKIAINPILFKISPGVKIVKNNVINTITFNIIVNVILIIYLKRHKVYFFPWLVYSRDGAGSTDQGNASLVGRTTPSRGMVSSPDIVRQQRSE